MGARKPHMDAPAKSTKTKEAVAKAKTGTVRKAAAKPTKKPAAKRKPKK